MAFLKLLCLFTKSMYNQSHRPYLYSILLVVMLGRTIFRCSCSAFASNIPVSVIVVQRATTTTTTTTTTTKRIPFTTGRQYFARGGSSRSSSLSTTNEQTACEGALDIVGSKLVQRDFGGTPYWDTSALNEFRVCFILGGPGAGKGTQSEFMKKQYPCVHLSAGELLRNVPTDSPHKALVEECLVAGNIVPVEISLSLLQAAMEHAATATGRSQLFLIDGFPRNYDNLQGWTKCMNQVASVWGVLMFTCPFEELERRILSRAKTSGRSDDNVKSAQKRFATFERETVAVVNTLRRVQEKQEAAGQPALQVVDIQGDQSIEAVWQDTQRVMNTLLLNDVLTANARLLKATAEGDVESYAQLYAIPAGMAPATIMEAQESDAVIQVSNTKVEFVTGTKVVVSYDRSDHLRETRVWSHQGVPGWINIHFSRIPIC